VLDIGEPEGFGRAERTGRPDSAGGRPAAAPWLAMRAAADAADGIGGLLALRAGTRCAEQASTTRSALVLSGVEALLWCISVKCGDHRSREPGRGGCSGAEGAT
jgi:hypothetical protein